MALNRFVTVPSSEDFTPGRMTTAPVAGWTATSTSWPFF